MFSCSHYGDFLSDDQDWQQSAMSNRSQEATSNEDSLVTKARPCLVARDPKSEEISSHNLVYLVYTENSDERKEVEIAAGNSWRIHFKIRSRVLSSESTGEFSSGCWKQLAGGATSENIPWWESILTPIEQGNLCWVRQNQSFRTWDTKTTNTLPRFFNSCKRSWECQQATQLSRCKQAYKTHLLVWRMFMSSSMNAAIHLGPNYLTNSEIYKNTKFEETESLFNITQKVGNGTFRRDSVCKMAGIFITVLDEISVISWSND